MYRKMQNGTFPPAIKISTRCAGSRESDVAAWLRNPVLNSAGDRLADADALRH